MKECEKIVKMYLSGERNKAVKEHLAKCQDCRSLITFAEDISPVRLPVRSVPEELDQKVLSYASGKCREKQNKSRFIIFFRKYALPAAAAAVFCIGIPLLINHQGKKETVVRTARADHQAFAANSAFADADQMNVELMLLSTRISDSRESLTRTAALTAAMDLYK